jgi:hypothetical protein
MKTLQQQFEEITKIKIFEIEVIKKGTKETDYIIFDIDMLENKLIATHESLTIEQKNSNKIAFVSVDLDECFSIDEHLEKLHNYCLNAILDSDFYELTYE